eukprot:12724697-Prorocentrum_lima.AAC.1
MSEAQSHMREMVEQSIAATMSQLPTMLSSTIQSLLPLAPPGALGGHRLPQETPLPAAPLAALED